METMEIRMAENAEVMLENPVGFNPEEIEHFHQWGFLVAKKLAPQEITDALLKVSQDHHYRKVEPLEMEADLNYPGAPSSRDAQGGLTVRRLKQAHSRGLIFTTWLNYPGVLRRLQQLVGVEIVCPLAHHNCVMTKEPDFSSVTQWHQDIRYWSFTRPELISVWLALGQEFPANGCLRVIPGSHRERFQSNQFDEELFFRGDLPENQEVLDRSQDVLLEPGDVLFFHCRLLHSAGQNTSEETKYSVVFTYRSLDNPPLSGTRSSSSPEMLLHGES